MTGMHPMSGPRTQAERDAATVEIMFAVVTGALLAALLFFVCASPALFGDLGRAAEKTWLTAAAGTATAGFFARVLQVLWWLPRKRRG
ncbi:DUF6332 family protein [Streptomyces sp. ME19-01-6]|uniref:DUF6332 family protein n=1 Tax=Streptomyces sp. ME19-01-6 TaxID=3028686 RepID=UPI0029B1EB49|nr:DUF6332 family protein [Streptomyces sp. ME19-01-6]MDX3228180.1 DUF6332 family protein [Streptomyces sp. ME19-01-6]